MLMPNNGIEKTRDLEGIGDASPWICFCVRKKETFVIDVFEGEGGGERGTLI
jgi:hypothetical protein